MLINDKKRKLADINDANDVNDDDDDDINRENDIINSIMGLNNTITEITTTLEVPLQENEKTERCDQLLFHDMCTKLQLIEDKRSQKVTTYYYYHYYHYYHY